MRRFLALNPAARARLRRTSQPETAEGAEAAISEAAGTAARREAPDAVSDADTVPCHAAGRLLAASAPEVHPLAAVAVSAWWKTYVGTLRAARRASSALLSGEQHPRQSASLNRVAPENSLLRQQQE